MTQFGVANSNAGREIAVAKANVNLTAVSVVVRAFARLLPLLGDLIEIEEILLA